MIDTNRSTTWTKEQEEKKTSRGSTNSGNHEGKGSGRERGGHNYGNNKRPSKDPNSKDYEGDGSPSECSSCTPKKDGTKKIH